jgi:hypothetical protein
MPEPSADPPPRAIAAARRLVGPAKVLAALCRVLWIVAAVAGGLFWLEAFLPIVLGGPTWGEGVVALVALVVLAVPAWWLRHARETFVDVVGLPARLDALRGGRPRFSIESRDDLRALRRGGVLDAARTIRTTVGEVADVLSPASTVIEVAAPPFWLWTAGAAVATVVLVLLAVVVGPLVLLFTS